MDKAQMFKQMAGFNQTMFNDFTQALQLFQSRFEGIDKAADSQNETRKFLENWDNSFMEK